MFVWTRDRENIAYARFNSLWLMFEYLRMLSTFSALRLFSLCHPALVGRRFKEAVAEIESPLSFYIAATFFGISRLVAAGLSTIAFAVKLAMVSIQFYTVEAHPAFVP